MKKRISASRSSVTLRNMAFKAMASPHRLELITALGDAGEASIAELAQRLGRTPHSLYYHMKLLEESRIVVPAQTRRRGQRDEQVWKLAADRFLLDGSLGPGGFDAGRSKAIDSMLRLTARELQLAIDRASGAPKSGEREIIGVRMKGRIGETTLKQINRLIDRIESLLRKSNPGSGRMFSLTIVLSPVEDRASQEATDVR